ncbi:pentapeptide repeat-containing protein [Nocardioides pacificus]
MVLPFSRSADFAFDKAAGETCRHLGDDDGCTIHDELRPRGFPGCTVFDCFGAGQRVVNDTCAGQPREEMAGAFAVLRQLHEVLWHLEQALGMGPDAELRADLTTVLDAVRRDAAQTGGALLGVDPGVHRARVGALLDRVAGQARGEASPGPTWRGADRVGADLRGTDLRRADLRGVRLIAADLRGVDLELADLLGADLRDADLRGAHLERALFLSQSQVNAARGDGATTLPSALARPSHW